MHLEDRAREFVGKVMQCVKYMDVDMDVYFTTSNNIISQISDIFLHTLFTRKEESAKKAQAYISLFVVVSHFVHSRYTLKRKMIIWLTKCNVHIVRKKKFLHSAYGKRSLVFLYTHRYYYSLRNYLSYILEITKIFLPLLLHDFQVFL